MGRLSFLVAIANVHSLSSWLAPALLPVTCENGHSEWWDLICHCDFNLHPPVIIRDVQNLILLQGGNFFSPFILFFKGCQGNLPVAIGFLNIGCVWNLLLQCEPQILC